MYPKSIVMEENIQYNQLNIQWDYVLRMIMAISDWQILLRSGLGKSTTLVFYNHKVRNK